jgi:preprotein translocase subunit SecA
MTGREGFTARDVDHGDDADELFDAVCAYLQGIYDEKAETLGHEVMQRLAGQVMLRIIDSRWMTHLQEMDYLKTGIGLRGYGQRDPLVEYKEEAHKAFGAMTAALYEDFLRTLLRLQIAIQEIPEEAPQPRQNKMSYSNPEENLGPQQGSVPTARQAPAGGQAPEGKEVAKPQTYVKDKDDPWANVGRNDPCPCGSGKKYKKCHGAAGGAQ